jgi:hypothetical protein
MPETPYHLPTDAMLRVFARCWDDKDFDQRFQSDPKSALKEYGVEVPENISLVVLHDDASTRHIVVPLAPTEDELRTTSSRVVLADSTVSVCRPCSCFHPSAA